MKQNERKEARCLPWIRAVRDEIYRDTKGMNPDEVTAYFQARALKVQNSPLLTPEEAEKAKVAKTATDRRKVKATPKTTASRRKVKATPKTTAPRRKVSKRLVHA